MDLSLDLIPEQLQSFALVTIFSLLIGLSQRKLQERHEGDHTTFGTDRTFTFIGILGYLLYILDPLHYTLFLGGGAALIIFLALSYYGRVMKFESFGITTILIALITYLLAPTIMTQPSWFSILVVVVVLTLTEMKHKLKDFASEMRNDEIITAAKFLAISGIILPILPKENIIEGINLTPYSVWLATVIVSGISYVSYLIKRFVFPKSGLLISAILGGLYSSTATTAILARDLKTAPANKVNRYVAALMLAKSMMFLRFIILIFIFSTQVFKMVYIYLFAMTLVSIFISWLVFRHNKHLQDEQDVEIDTSEEFKNPLEFKVALIFASLFVFFTVLTTYTIRYIGAGGVSALSIISGFTDITPFILNLLQNIGEIDNFTVASSIMLAIISSTIMKTFYGYFFSGRRKESRNLIFISSFAAIGVNLVLLVVMYYTM